MRILCQKAKNLSYGSKPSSYFEALSPSTRALAKELRKIVKTSVPNASESIKWGVPVYEQNGLICGIRCGDDFASLQFFTSGINLSDPDGLLEGTGKGARHVKVRIKKDIHNKLFSRWVRQVAAQNTNK